MRIFLMGSHPKFRSGMSKVTDEIAKRLSLYFDVTVYSPQTETAEPEEYHGYKLVGNPFADPTGQNMFAYHYMQGDYDITITNLNWQSVTFMDGPLNQAYMNQGKKTHVLLYVPIETLTKPPQLENALLNRHLNPVHLIPFSRPLYEKMGNEWGLEDYIFNPDGFVPHGVDRSVYKPHPQKALAQRQQMGIGNKFVVFFNSENWRRKNIDILVEAYRKFQEDKNDTVLILHTSPSPSRGNDPFFSGWDMPNLIARHGLHQRENVIGTKQHPAEFITEEEMATMYSMADVYVLPTGGEAFSLTSLEAMSTGVPGIHTDLENLRWLCGDSSLYVKSVGETCMRTGEPLAIPSADDLAEKMQYLYENPNVRRKMGNEGMERAKEFTWAKAGKKLVKLIEEKCQ